MCAPRCFAPAGIDSLQTAIDKRINTKIARAGLFITQSVKSIPQAGYNAPGITHASKLDAYPNNKINNWSGALLVQNGTRQYKREQTKT